MKHKIENLLQQSIKNLKKANLLPKEVSPLFQVEGSKDKKHGDFASNIAMTLAKAVKRSPRDVATLIIDHLPTSPWIEKVEIAGPGFINFFLSPIALTEIVNTVLTEKENFGRSNMGRNKQVLVEFVSSNPTGPLHVGHGRHAAYGAVVANLLNAVGFKTSCEYYVNDAGRQMDILAVSAWIRYLTLCGNNMPFPANGYQGNYVMEIAQQLKKEHDVAFRYPDSAINAALPADESQGGDKEKYIDALIARAKKLLGENYAIVYDAALHAILEDIREDLTAFGVRYDHWYSERENITNRVIEVVFDKLKTNNSVYEKDGAIWFKSTLYGDEKDRVLVRSNGTRTYFANDVAYHFLKYERNFDIAIVIFGSDHHGYISRMKASVEALGINPERLVHLLMQFVTLYRNGEQISMSTRGGDFVTLRELREEVGNDAARFFYVMRKHEQHMDFDLDLAKKQSNENPVFYVQYAYARIASVLKQLIERGIQYDETMGREHLDLLTEPLERELLNTLSRYPDMIINAALQYEPHLLTHYLRDLAANFHAYYNSHQFLVDDEQLRNARLALIMAVRQTLANGFNLLGISARESM